LSIVKQIIAIIVLSVFVLLSISYAHQGLQLVISLHEWIADILTEVFSGGTIGTLLRNLIALIGVPAIIGLLPAGVYWIVKRRWFPYFMEIVWIVWLIQVGALIMMYKAPVI